MEDLERIKKTLDSGSGKALKRYLQARLNELKSVENLKDIDNPEHLATEIKGQKKAYQKLREILQDLMTFEEEAREKDERDSFAVE